MSVAGFGAPESVSDDLDRNMLPATSFELAAQGLLPGIRIRPPIRRRDNDHGPSDLLVGEGLSLVSSSSWKSSICRRTVKCRNRTP